MKYDILTFGSATLDIFLKTSNFLIKPEEKFIAQKAVCFPFSSKVDLEELSFFTGGGGTNVAVSFSNQGFQTGYCGMIGQDIAGKEILKDLKRFKIDASLVLETREAQTNLSVIFSWGRDRTCFIWRGASELLRWSKISSKTLSAKWFYMAPLSGKLSNIFQPLVYFALKNKIKVFANPGNSQIRQGIKKISPILQKINVLLLNEEEASVLTNISREREIDVLKKISDGMNGIVIITKGEKGVVVSNGEYLWRAKSLPVSVAEKTGAGDAFGSGFLGGLIRKNDIVFAIQSGIANSVACIQKKGAKNGLLKKGETWEKVRVVKKRL